MLKERFINGICPELIEKDGEMVPKTEQDNDGKTKVVYRPIWLQEISMRKAKKYSAQIVDFTAAAQKVQLLISQGKTDWDEKTSVYDKQIFITRDLMALIEEIIIKSSDIKEDDLEYLGFEDFDVIKKEWLDLNKIFLKTSRDLGIDILSMISSEEREKQKEKMKEDYKDTMEILANQKKIEEAQNPTKTVEAVKA